LAAAAPRATTSAAPEIVEIHAGNVSELPEGREADGIIGDFLMRNDLVEAVISHNAPLRRANMSTFYGDDGVTPGCLYDLTRRGRHRDNLTIFTPGNQQGKVSWVRVVSRPDDPEAVVETARTAASGGGLAVRHEYRMRAAEPGLWITSVWTNESAAVREIEAKDVWTRFETHGIQGKYHWADAVDPAEKCGYAFGWVEPEEASLPGLKVKLEPGASFRVKRFLAVADSPAAALGHVAAIYGEARPWKLTIRDAAGNAVPDAVARFHVSDTVSIPGYPDEKGNLALSFPEFPGLRVSVEAPGRASVSGVANGSDVVLGAPSAVRFAVTDGTGASIPCKVQFHGIEGTPRPDLGPNLRAHGCLDQWHSERGDFEVRLAPGKYRVVVTRGPEHGHHEEIISLAPGQTVPVSAKLARQVDSTGWISADFHNHTTISGDNICGTPDRIINMAVEHLEFVPTTEHNRIIDWSPYIQKLGLTKFLTTVPGMELTGRGAHLNSFPLVPAPRVQDGGAPVWETDPRVNVHHLMNHGGWDPAQVRWTQINHPDLSENFVDRNLDGTVDGGFQFLEGLLGGVETQNYSTSQILSDRPFHIADPLAKGSRVQVIREFVWLQLLNTGKRLWGVAVADAHAIHGNGTGSWRTYLPSSSDDPDRVSATEIIRHAQAGRMILSSAPFLQVRTPDGETAGATVTARDGQIVLDVKVQCADWYDIDRVQVLVSGRQVPELNFTRASHPALFAAAPAPVRFHQPIPVKLERDAHLIVVAIGEQSSLEKGFGTSAQAPVKPCAYNNPIFVDLAGDGFEPNGDTLGFPLVVGGITVDQARALLEARDRQP
jgi:hypothetical protein